MMNTSILNALPSFAMSPIGTFQMSRSVRPPVRRIAADGVSNRSLTCSRRSGAKLSRLIAKGYREAERMPALAVLTSARTAASTTVSTPTSGSVVAATSATGVCEPTISSPGAAPTMTTTTTTYMRVVNPSEPSIPSGMTLPGFSTSSAMLATFVTPA